MTAITPDRVDLTTSLADITLDNPVMTASGCGGTGRELAAYVDLAGLGAFVTGSVRRDPSPGEPAPRLVETPAGLLWATGLPGPGVDGFLARDLPWLLQRQARPVVSIAGTSLGEVAELSRRVGQAPGVAALELALSWPGTARPSTFATDPLQAHRAVAAVRRDAPRGLPVLVKLGLDLPDPVAHARAVCDAGADGLVVGGSPRGIALDPRTLRPALAGVTGALSGPAANAQALEAVWRVARELPDVTIVGVGGITDGAAALAMLAVGATAVQVGSAVLHDPTSPGRILGQLRAALAAHGFSRASDAVRVAHADERVTTRRAASPSEARHSA